MRAAGLAADRGYVNVYTFIGGIPEWRKFNYPMVIDDTFAGMDVVRLSPGEVFTLIQTKDYYVLDVRPLDFDRETSFIPGARLCPLVYLESRYNEIPIGTEIIITDWAMRQSPSAAKFLMDKGYRVTGILKGGMERWKSENLPFEERTPDGMISPLSQNIDSGIHNQPEN